MTNPIPGLTGLKFYVDTKIAAPHVSSAANIDLWSDQSGQGNHLNTLPSGVNAPQLQADGSLKVVAGSSQGIVHPGNSVTGTAGHCFGLVIKVNAAIDNSILFGDSDLSYGGVNIKCSTTSWAHENYSSSSAGIDGTIDTTAYHIIIWDRPAASNSILYYDNTTPSLTSNTTGNPLASMGSTGYNGICIGTFGNFNSAFSSCQILAAFICSASIGSTNAGLVYDWWLASEFSQALTMTLTAGNAGARSLSRAVGTPLSAASSGARTVTRGVGRPLSASSAGARALARALARPLSATEAGAASVVRAAARPISAMDAAGAVVIRGVARPVSATAQGGLVIVRGVGRPLAAAAVETPTASRGVAPASLTSSSLAAPSLGSFGLGLARATTNQGATSLGRAVGQTPSIPSSGAPALGRSVGTLRTASSAGLATEGRAIGAVRTSTSTGAPLASKNVGQARGAASSGSPSSQNSVGQTLGATASSTPLLASLAIGLLRALSGQGTPTMARRVGETQVATATGAPTLVRYVGAARSAASTASTSLLRRLGRTVSALSSALADVLAEGIAAGGTDHPVTLTATASQLGSLVRALAKVYSAPTSGAPSIGRSVATSRSAQSVASPTARKGIVPIAALTASGAGLATRTARVGRPIVATSSGLASLGALQLGKLAAVTGHTAIALGRALALGFFRTSIGHALALTTGFVDTSVPLPWTLGLTQSTIALRATTIEPVAEITSDSPALSLRAAGARLVLTATEIEIP